MAERIVIQKKLEEAIAVMKPGSAFTAADFSYLNDPDSVNKALSRIAESGKIRDSPGRLCHCPQERLEHRAVRIYRSI